MLLQEWSAYRDLELDYTHGDTWDRMLQQGIQLLNRLARTTASVSANLSTISGQEVERHLTGKETEPWEIIYFKLYKTQIPIIEQALETAALMLGSDKSRSYCLEMICADFLAGANLDGASPKLLLTSIQRFFQFLPASERGEFMAHLKQAS